MAIKAGGEGSLNADNPVFVLWDTLNIYPGPLGREFAVKQLSVTFSDNILHSTPNIKDKTFFMKHHGKTESKTMLIIQDVYSQYVFLPFTLY